MKIAFVSFLAFALFAKPASAEIKGCYEHQYDAAYLKAHPEQKITYMRLQYGFSHQPDAGESEQDMVDYRVSGIKALKSYPFECKDYSAHPKCSFEYNKKGVTLAETKTGIQFTSESALEKFNDAAGGKAVVEPATAGNRTFVLEKVGKRLCLQ